MFEADARIHVEKLEEELGIVLLPDEEEEDFDTLGGLIFFHLGRVPARGEIIDYPHAALKFEIVDADPRRIKKVRVTRNITPHSED